MYAAFDYLSDAAHASKLVVEIGSLDGREPDAWSIRVIPSTLDTKVRGEFENARKGLQVAHRTNEG